MMTINYDQDDKDGEMVGGGEKGGIGQEGKEKG